MPATANINALARSTAPAIIVGSEATASAPAYFSSLPMKPRSGGKPAIDMAAHGGRGGGDRHRAPETAQHLRLAGAGGVIDAADDEKKRRLVKRVNDKEGREGGHRIAGFLAEKTASACRAP